MSSLAIAILLAFISFATATTVPAIFIFGDSTADVGNNNYLTTLAKANYLPYGVDLVPANGSGRFSNGLNSADFIAKMLGFRNSPPPFLSLTSFTEVQKGVNFASAGSGIGEATGSIYGQVISLGKQVQYFETIRSNLTVQMGSAATEDLLSKSIFFISSGSNDIFEAYAALGHLNNTQKSNLVAGLVMTYKTHVKTLYNLGARKVGVIGIPAIGCCPTQRSLNSSGGCLDGPNHAARDFHVTMKATFKDLRQELPMLKYAIGNTYQMVISFFDNPLVFGFTETKAACCGGGKLNGQFPCLQNSKICHNRKQYLFWDMYHPTQAGSKLAAQTLFGGGTKFVAPMNFAQLAAC